MSKGAAAFAAFVVLTQAFGAVYSQVWEWMLYALIILTITLGNLFAIRQTNMKRFLAFSSISQAGYIMLGVIACNATGVASLSYYVLVYVVSNLAAFGVIQAIENATGKVDMTDYNGLYKTNPKLSFAMMLAMFSLGGIPPFAGFFSKFFIFSSALEGRKRCRLRPRVHSIAQHDYLPLLLSACSEGDVHQSERQSNRHVQESLERACRTGGLRGRHHPYWSCKLHLYSA